MLYFCCLIISSSAIEKSLSVRRLAKPTVYERQAPEEGEKKTKRHKNKKYSKISIPLQGRYKLEPRDIKRTFMFIL